MKTLNVDLAGAPYPIHIGTGLLTRPELILPHLQQRDVAIVTNTTVAPLYLQSLQQALAQADVRSFAITLPDGEAYKTRETLHQIHDALLAHHCERKTTVIALGGGVIGDLAGFAAATFLRGVPLIQIPTTLLAQVDSSVGGKTGINHPLGKNLIGSFHQPRLVLADTRTLDTLPPREFRAGVAEIIKYGLIRDLPFLGWLDDHLEALMAREPDILAQAIFDACRNKAEVVAQDEFETTGLRALLNLGHTFGHAIEAGAGYGSWLHGEAVAAGTLIAAALSNRLGWITSAELDRIENLMTRAGLPLRAPDFGPERYLELMASDKKVEAGKLRFVLLKRLGEAILTRDVPQDALLAELSRDSGRFIGRPDELPR
ncbi:MAG: 3-dehydroquinate synthase [Betaproteobacteria bacterium]|nr:3-dehydroquinate synthase [Betaproteobacteria bacterium]